MSRRTWRNALVVAGLLSISASAFADAPKAPAAPLRAIDFSAGMAVQLPASSTPVVAVRVPSEVYRGVLDPELADIRVFNASGQQVPHALRTLSAPAPGPATRVALATFSLYGEQPAQGAQGALDLSIERSADGRVLAIHSRDVRAQAQAGQSAPPPVHGYLLDARGSDRPLIALRITLDAPPAGMVLSPTLEESWDLVSFRRLEVEGALVHLDFAGQRVERDRLTFAPTDAPFLRVRCPEACPANAVAIEGEREAVARAAELSWIEIKGVARVDAPLSYRFQLGGALPVDRIELLLPEDNTVAWAELLAGPNEKALRSLAQNRFYRITAEGEALHGPTLELARVREPLYELRVQDKGGGLGAGVPTLRAGHVPEEVLFVRRGAAPFTLAFGSRLATSASFASQELLGLLPEVHGVHVEPTLATLQPQQPLGGKAALQAPPPPVPWKTYVLWGVLIAGVLLLSVLALRLMRGMS